MMNMIRTITYVGMGVAMITGFSFLHDAPSVISFGDTIDTTTGDVMPSASIMPTYKDTNDVSYNALRGYIKDEYGKHACYMIQSTDIKQGLGEGGIIQYMVKCERFDYSVRVKYNTDDLISVVKI